MFFFSLSSYHKEYKRLSVNNLLTYFFVYLLDGFGFWEFVSRSIGIWNGLLLGFLFFIFFRRLLTLEWPQSGNPGAQTLL